MSDPYVIGVDLDNTIINYDKLFYREALEKKLIPSNVNPLKKEVRDKVRELHGDNVWQVLQDLVYVEKVQEAEINNGAIDFFKLCTENKIKKYIISHNKKILKISPSLKLLEDALFFSKEIGLNKEDVFFEPAREKKIERIKNLNCNYFIDDLEELFQEKSFPRHVKKLLYSNMNASLSDCLVFRTWEEISNYFFKK